eukprot:c15088_g1_i2.p1 GENE.c15088_g1_i2~~c15088_g1_i2.p1  ORF type:complete len:218 (+),score=76.59 c15088_g1_i2:17-670(+)
MKCNKMNSFFKKRLFHEGSPLEQSLRDVVEIHLFYQKNHPYGYIQGTSFIVAMFLLYMDEFGSFVSLESLFHSHPFGSFLRGVQTQKRFDFFGELLAHNLPLVAQHLKSLKISPDMYIRHWFGTFFTKILTAELAIRVFDNFLLDGEIFLYQCALGVLSLLSAKIQSLNQSSCRSLLCAPIHDLDETALFSAISSIKVSKAKFQKLQQNLKEEANSK